MNIVQRLMNDLLLRSHCQNIFDTIASVMSKFHIALFSTIIAVFFGIIVITEEGSMGHKAVTAPTIPPDGSTFQIITPTGPSHLNQQAANAQTQQQAQQQQQQGQDPNSPGYKHAASLIQGPMAASVSATIKTSKGKINIILFGDLAPNTVKNFVVKADTGFYNNLTFHRVEDWVIQGGDPKGDGTGGGQMGAEQTPNKPFVEGSVGVARGPNPQINNDSQFFITKSGSDWLNGQYTNFGLVTSGMSVVNSIEKGDKIESITINQ
jgi:peptidyl-prolyl cis-trans isomerase B (cyclophilin B)